MRECFVIMPIGSGETYEVNLNRYKLIIKSAVEGFRLDGAQVYRCVRADLVSRTGSITRDLLGRLFTSDVVIADLTELNPNVFYELGVRHALRSGTILIAHKGTKPPFDVGDLRIVPYEDRVGGEREAISQIQEMLRSLTAADRSVDSPVHHAIPQLNSASQEHDARISTLERERDLLRAQLEVSERTALANQATLAALTEAIKRLGSEGSKNEGKEAEEIVQSAVNDQARKASSSKPGTRKITAENVDSKSVFIMMPIEKGFEPVFTTIRDAAMRVGLIAYRADSLSHMGSIIEQVYEAINRAGLIVGDLTGRNPNVMYELGVAKAMDKRTLLLTQDLADLPFDVRQQRALVYKLSSMPILHRTLVDAFQEYIRDVEKMED